ncbi:hypothetical protein BV898_05134 [Hypsibius exemplaris]|uniref:Uncharacterized protein n=1 Tax=Hypsibius exemplaris TaxID=2072580 RepID=A0A1W0X0U3_HYPEX|nr:hypothetical protein BV898_05134 [Hypsibius exemplaris]
MSRKYIALLTVIGSLAVITTVTATPVKSSSPEEPSWKSFTCRYYSDGKYVCYPEHRSRNQTDDPAENDRVDKAFAIVHLGKPVTGTWETSDGFFTLLAPAGRKKYIGTCLFSETGAWQCSGPPTFTTHADGSMSGVGGGLFQGDHYTGIPGGPIKVSVKSEFPSNLVANGSA